ncbi:TonB-dependent receptor [Zobellella iuensis]|uniref:TonB-dependent receptor n=1 Tax=Zobellella iuensis TaxID=2803811 RepID=A0ABS1QYA2_9GAMM|nr:TonB-dependent receptor [Zobellella iuensis]MBL1379502.1 TonB-dependent receptor [Zobellella iuensis]
MHHLAVPYLPAQPARRPLFALSPLLLALMAAQGQAEVLTELPEVEVLGQRAPEAHRLKEGFPKVKIHRETFEEQPSGHLVKDVIKRLPGVYTGGAPGEDKDLRLRGLDKDYSRVQFDGVQLPDGGEKRELNLDRIPNALVGEVTLLRNPGAEYEADGLAGRVHIERREIPLAPLTEVTLAGAGRDSLGTDGKQLSISHGQRFNDRIGVQGVLSYIEDPLLKDKEKRSSGGLLQEREQEDKPAENLTLMLDGAYFYDQGEIHLKPLYIRDGEDKTKLKSKFKDDASLKDAERELEDKVKLTKGLGLDHQHKFDARTRLDSALGYYRTTEDKDRIKQKLDAELVENLTKRELEFEDKTDAFWQGETRLTHDWSGTYRHKLKTGAQVRLRERDRTKTVVKNGVAQAADAKFDYRLEEDYYAAFLQNETHLNERFSLLPGLRLEHVDLSSQDGAGNQGGNSGTDWLPSLSARYRLDEQLSLHAAYSRVLNRPKFDELSPYAQENNDKFVIGNPELEVAKAHAFDIGLDYVTGPLFLGANLFQRDIKGVIESRDSGETLDGKPVFQVQNVGDGYLRGLELEQRWALSSLGLSWLAPFTLTANQSFIKSQLENADGSKASFKDQPDFIGNLILDWHLPATGTTASVAAKYVSSIDKGEGDDRIAGETFVDARLTQAITKDLSVYLLAKNLTDEDRVKYKSSGETEVESGGRYFWLGLNARF